jgi:hypothetical protein
LDTNVMVSPGIVRLLHAFKAHELVDAFDVRRAVVGVKSLLAAFAFSELVAGGKTEMFASYLFWHGLVTLAPKGATATKSFVTEGDDVQTLVAPNEVARQSLIGSVSQVLNARDKAAAAFWRSPRSPQLLAELGKHVIGVTDSKFRGESVLQSAVEHTLKATKRGEMELEYRFGDGKAADMVLTPADGLGRVVLEFKKCSFEKRKAVREWTWPGLRNVAVKRHDGGREPLETVLRNACEQARVYRDKLDDGRVSALVLMAVGRECAVTCKVGEAGEIEDACVAQGEWKKK